MKAGGLTLSLYRSGQSLASISGYILKVGIGKHTGVVYFNPNKKHLLDKVEGQTGDILRAISSYFKTNITIKHYSHIVTIDTTGKPEGFLKDAASGKIDFVLNPMLSRDYWKMQTTSLYENSMCIVSKIQSVKLIDEFTAVIKIEVYLIISVFSVASIASIKYVMRLSFCDANLEFIRMFTGSAFKIKLRYLSEKLFFVTLIILANLMASSLFSLLGALKTKSSLKVINTIDELNKSNLTVYIMKNHVSILPRVGYTERYDIIPDFWECYKKMNNIQPNAACLAPCSVMRQYFEKNEFVHVAEDKHQLKGQTVMTTAVDWPLYKKFDIVLKRMVYSGLLSWYEKNHIQHYSIKYRTSEHKKEVSYPELRFAAFIFIGGLAVAVLVFFVEYFNNWIKNVCKLIYICLRNSKIIFLRVWYFLLYTILSNLKMKALNFLRLIKNNN